MFTPSHPALMHSAISHIVQKMTSDPESRFIKNILTSLEKVADLQEQSVWVELSILPGNALTCGALLTYRFKLGRSFEDERLHPHTSCCLILGPGESAARIASWQAAAVLAWWKQLALQFCFPLECWKVLELD